MFQPAYVFVLEQDERGVLRSSQVYGNFEAAMEAVEQHRADEGLGWLPSYPDWYWLAPPVPSLGALPWDLLIRRASFKIGAPLWGSRERVREYAVYQIKRMPVLGGWGLSSMTEGQLDDLQVAIDLQRSRGIGKS